MVIYLIGYGAGGAEALDPIYLRLKAREDVVIKNISLSPFSAARLTDPITLTEDELYSLLTNHPPDLVINERSNGLPLQNALTKFCREQKIKNIVVLDLFGNIKQRFTEIPDLILVPGESIKEDLIQEGITALLKVTGNPAFDRLNTLVYVYPENHPPKGLFISQPLCQNPEAPNIYQLFKKTHEEVVREGWTLDVKLHPMEDREAWVSFLKDFHGTLIVQDENDALLNCLPYNFVIGYNSTVLLQTYLLDIPTTFLDESVTRYLDFEPHATENCIREILQFLPMKK